MKRKEKTRNLISKLQLLHKLVIIFWFISVYLMFFTTYKLIGIVYLLIVGGFNIFHHACPLTTFEDRLLKLSGSKKRVMNFTPRFLKESFGIKISYKTTRIVMLLFFIIALLYLIKILIF